MRAIAINESVFNFPPSDLAASLAASLPSPMLIGGEISALRRRRLFLRHRRGVRRKGGTKRALIDIEEWL